MHTDDFIPVNHSTPKSHDYSSRQRYGGNLQMKPRFNNSWNHRGARSRNNSFNRSHSSRQEQDISAYISPSMLEDPWERLRSRDSSSHLGSTVIGNTKTFSDSVTPMPDNTAHSFGSMPSTAFDSKS